MRAELHPVAPVVQDFKLRIASARAPLAFVAHRFRSEGMEDCLPLGHIVRRDVLYASEYGFSGKRHNGVTERVTSVHPIG